MVALIIGLTNCNQAKDEHKKHFTPLFVYFNPMGLDMNVATLTPYFVNYPTDWAKLGLKHYPMRVTYNAFDPTWKIPFYSEYVFFANGSLSEYFGPDFQYNANWSDIISFEYDDNTNLVRILSEHAGKKNKYVDGGFIYDVDGRLVQRDKKYRGRHSSAFTFYYMYHDNGALKAILPEKEDGSVYEGGVTLSRMDFDSLAHLVRLETPYSSNLFLEDLNKDKKGKSVVTYTYTDNLCTQAVEKIAVKFDEGTDTLVNVSSFMYNSHGDLVSWNYSGGVYKSKGNSWWVDHMKFTITYDYVYDENGKKTAVLNHKETTAAQAKQEVIKQAFQDWIWKDPERRNRLVRYYNDTFNSVRPREYDGSHIKFGGISPEITLRPHQVNAIAHILYGGNTLLAHKVGAGKTFEMVAAAQESKRLGLCQKSMFVVPNHLVGQWASEYLRLYPSANILVTTKQDFETGNRKKFCGRIATGDYDAVIIGHSQFEKIPISEERQREQLMRQLDDIERGIDDVQANKGEQFTVKQLMKTRKAIKAKLDKLNDTKRKDNVINFEELGVDRLFVDEADGYKNLYLTTKMRNVGGIAQTEAQKSSDMYMKCRYLDEITGNRGIRLSAIRWLCARKGL